MQARAPNKVMHRTRRGGGAAAAVGGHRGFDAGRCGAPVMAQPLARLTTNGGLP